jgi:hypothetical protein
MRLQLLALGLTLWWLTATVGLSRQAAPPQGHIGGHSASINPGPDAFHSPDAPARFDLSKRWMKNDVRGFAPFAHADDLMNKQVWAPFPGTGAALLAVHGGTILFGIEIWQKAERRKT